VKALRAFLVASALSAVVLATEPVNINTADAETLATLQGIGEKRAEAIIDYRSRHGPFVSVDDLVKVKGIGDKTLEKNRDRMTVE
jgi:competence protein ComEA